MGFFRKAVRGKNCLSMVHGSRFFHVTSHPKDPSSSCSTGRREWRRHPRTWDTAHRAGRVGTVQGDCH